MSVTFYASRDEVDSGVKYYMERITGPNWSNMNARAMLAFLGMENDEPNGLTGAVSIPEARRAVIKARALFEKRAPKFARETIDEGNFISVGLSVENIEYRLDDFERFVGDAEKAGAKSIYWA